MSDPVACPRCRRPIPNPTDNPERPARCPGCGLRVTPSGQEEPPGPSRLRLLVAGALGTVAGLVVAGLVLAGVVIGTRFQERKDRAKDAERLARGDAARPDAGKARADGSLPVIIIEPGSSEPSRPAGETPTDPPAPPDKGEGGASPREEQGTTREAPTGPSPPAPSPEKAKAAFKRVQVQDAEELRKQLLNVPELALDAVPNSSVNLMAVAPRLQGNGWPYPGPALVLGQRPDLAGLPLRMGLDCQLGKEPAEELQALSRKLRTHLEASIPRGSADPRPDPDVLRRRLMGSDQHEWLRPDAIPALLQLLQAESKPARLVLVELLAKIDHRRSTEALAVRAVLDLSPEVREAAVRALQGRPREDYRDLLLAGLRYPWIPAQQHAAEALVALRHEEATPQLVRLLDETPGTQPFTVTQGKKETAFVRELVRVNHLANCVLCHAPSFDRGDLVRGAVPTPGQPLPAPVTTPQYYDRGGRFVRADVTYLRQDFSVVQTVADPGRWPANQRYDYMVRLRRLTPQELKVADAVNKDLTLQARLREPVLFALRELTGKDMGTEPRHWQTLLRSSDGPPPAEPAGERTAAGDWGQLLTATSAPGAAGARREAARLAGEVAGAPADKQREAIGKIRDGKGAVYTEALALAITQLDGEARKAAREALAERMARMTSETLANKLADDDPEVRRAAALAVGMKEDRSHVYKLVELIDDADESVARAAHASLKSLSNEDFGPKSDASPEDRRRARIAWAVWWASQQQEKK